MSILVRVYPDVGCHVSTSLPVYFVFVLKSYGWQLPGHLTLPSLSLLFWDWVLARSYLAEWGIDRMLLTIPEGSQPFKYEYCNPPIHCTCVRLKFFLIRACTTRTPGFGNWKFIKVGTIAWLHSLNFP